MKDEIFDRKIKELADSYSETPAPDIWNRIESGLDRKRRVLRWKRIVSYAAAAAIVAGLFVTALLYPTDPVLQENRIAVAGDTDTDGEGIRVREQIADLKPGPMASGMVVSTEHRPLMSAKLRPAAAVPRPEGRIEVSGVEVREEVMVEEKSLPSIYDRSVQADYIAMAEEVSDVPERRHSSFSIAASGHLSPTSAAGNVDFSQPSYTLGGTAASSSFDMLPVTEPRHRFPVSVGLELKYSFLNDRFGIGIGVNYTFLNSQYDALVSDTNNPYHYTYEGDVEQSVHYIGVPLNFYVNILSSKRLAFYANVGCMVERAVRIDYDITDLYGTRFRKSLEPVGVQWSANAGIGLEYRFLDFLGIYVDPRLTYFFDCGQPYSVRMEQPLQFNLELGFRFHI